ncbi:MAG TPA: endonuclease/exonuclease/phosphatase family protein [Acidimicrobiia bacterium]|nr:endonuclease/exonuclease/phosphatase family protein [Acidimicrobiia bacterium]
MLRLLTANLLFDHADTASFARLLDEASPDVVALQELGADVASAVAERFPYHDLRPTDDSRGMGMAARHRASFDLIPMPHHDALVAEVEDGPRIVSVHVSNPVEPPFVEPNRRRRIQVRALLDDIDGSRGTLVVAGDFNASPMWPAYRRITEVLDDAVVQAVGKRQARRLKTWGPRLIGGRRVLRIDHVFVRGLRGVDARVVPVRGSDHAAVVVDLEETA